jgi:hypothetical protein
MIKNQGVRILGLWGLGGKGWIRGFEVEFGGFLGAIGNGFLMGSSLFLQGGILRV